MLLELNFPLHHIFNKSRVKFSYSTTISLRSIIASNTKSEIQSQAIIHTRSNKVHHFRQSS